ncbi:MAG: hypothetical protein IJI56_01915 [Firmicutes bacterium]|jgi:hypothetical protein|nr:hypothetical protein [Bacillota bacterium]
MAEKNPVKNSEEGYEVLAEKLNLPMEDPAQRKAFVKNLIKTFAEL